MEILGWISALIIGLTLGLLGGGGSILTVPVLVYMLKIDPVIATGYSLFIVGVASLVGAARYLKKGEVDLRTAGVFGASSIVSVYLTRKFLIPAIPEQLLQIGGFALTRDVAIMVLFAILMLAASYFMIRPLKNSDAAASTATKSNPFLFFQGLVIGLLAGLVGAGGGFIIIPVLVLLSGLKMKTAIGTSLTIITINSLMGFLGDVQTHIIDWRFLLTFAAISIVGIVLGTLFAQFIPSKKLKPSFGWFVLFMGIYILGKELLI